MTSRAEYYEGRRVFVTDKTHELYNSLLRIIIVRVVKKGVLCEIEGGTQKVFKVCEIGIYPRD